MEIKRRLREPMKEVTWETRMAEIAATELVALSTS